MKPDQDGLVRIRSVGVGEICVLNAGYISTEDMSVCVVCHEFDRTLICWNGERGTGWEIVPRRFVDNPPARKIVSPYKYGYWVSSDLLVKVASPVKDRNLKCDRCQLPAPHTDKNVDDKYVCDICNMMEYVNV